MYHCDFRLALRMLHFCAGCTVRGCNHKPSEFSWWSLKNMFQYFSVYWSILDISITQREVLNCPVQPVNGKGMLIIDEELSISLISYWRIPSKNTCIKSCGSCSRTSECGSSDRTECRLMPYSLQKYCFKYILGDFSMSRNCASWFCISLKVNFSSSKYSCMVSKLAIQCLNLRLDLPTLSLNSPTAWLAGVSARKAITAPLNVISPMLGTVNG